jgi:hypothetical protein
MYTATAACTVECGTDTAWKPLGCSPCTVAQECRLSARLMPDVTLPPAPDVDRNQRTIPCLLFRGSLQELLLRRLCDRLGKDIIGELCGESNDSQRISRQGTPRTRCLRIRVRLRHEVVNRYGQRLGAISLLDRETFLLAGPVGRQVPRPSTVDHAKKVYALIPSQQLGRQLVGDQPSQRIAEQTIRAEGLNAVNGAQTIRRELLDGRGCRELRQPQHL